MKITSFKELSNITYPGLDKAPISWPSRTFTDLSEVKKIIEQNHPALAVSKNEFTSFHNWLENGFIQASEMAKSALSIEAYISCIAFFVAGFHDGHLRFSPNPLPDYTWPGFLLSYKDGKFIASCTDETNKESLLNHSEVAFINNEESAHFIEKYIFPYLRETPQKEKTWIKAAALSLIDFKRFGQPEISEITYKNPDGTLHTHQLQKRKIEHNQLINELQKASSEIKHEFRIEPFGDNGIWISIPSFNSNNSDNREQLEKLILKLPDLRHHSQIVFDLRGNTGGDSKWVVDILEAFYGLDYLNSISLSKDIESFAEVRVTEKQLNFLENQLDLEHSPQEKDAINEEIKKIKKAILKGDSTYIREVDVNYFNTFGIPKNEAVTNPVKGQVYLLTDHQCFSSGLIFADLILSIPGVKHIGQETDGDTVFSQPIFHELNSKLGKIACPSLIKRNRSRKDNETYIPEKIFTGCINDLQALQNWVTQIKV